MQTLNLLAEHIGDMEDAKLVINEFHWFLNVEEEGGQWTVTSGETVIFTADSKDAVEAFLYGMALAYKGLPPHLYAKLFSMLAGTSLEELEQVDLDLIDADDEKLQDMTADDFPNADTSTTLPPPILLDDLQATDDTPDEMV